MKPRSRQIRSKSRRRKAENSIDRDSNSISGRRVCLTNSRERKIKNFSCRCSNITAERRKICSSASYCEITQQSTAFNFKPNNNTGVSGVSVSVVNRHKNQASYTENVTVINKSVGMETRIQCSECGEVALSMRTLKKYHLTAKPLCLVCWKTESKLKLRSSMSKECFVRLTDVMKIGSFRKLLSQNKEVFGQRAKRKSTELCPPQPHKFMRKEVRQTESSKIVKRPRRDLKTTVEECKKSISCLQENVIISKNSIKPDVKLFHFTQEVINSSRKSLDTSKTCAYALRHERKCSPEVLASGSETRLKQTRSVSGKLSVTHLKPKPIVPYTCSVCLATFSQLKNGKVHELKHCDRFPVLVLKRCKTASSQVSIEANRAKAYKSEAEVTSTTGVNTRSKDDKGVQVNFADESEAQQTGSTV
jgi:hypothetical protein